MTKIANRISGIINRVQYEKWRKKIEEASLVNRQNGTSLSDDGLYPAFCMMAANDNEIFNDFRRNVIYNGILEHISKEKGQEYLDAIIEGEKEEKSGINYTWTNYQKNDSFGNPRMYTYLIEGKNVEIAPTTLRYVRVLQDISKQIGFSDIKHIAEIGIGYGGQCRIISTLGMIQEYSLYDLPEVLALSRKYLENFDGLPKINYIDGTKLPESGVADEFDLVISNYAFSELTRCVQDIYLESVISKSKHGYITWNALSYLELDGYSKDELLKMIPNSREEKEYPSTSADNCVIVW